jgi:urea transport system permease protein
MIPAKPTTETYWKIALTVLVVAVILLLPFMLENFRISLMGKYLAYALAAVSLNLIWGYTGILSLGHGVFFTLGAYVMAYHLKLQTPGLPDFMAWSGLSQLPWFIAPLREAWVAYPLVVLVPAVFAFLIGWPTFKAGIKGVYFTILSQALALALSIFFIGQQAYTGGTNGITSFKGFFGISIRNPEQVVILYFVTAAFLFLSLWMMHILLKTKTGKILVAIRDGENRLRFLGYNPVNFKLFVFTVSGGLAGLAGALFAPQVGIVSPAAMGILPSVEMAIWVAVGGRGTLIGPVIGAIVVNAAKTFFSETFPEVWLYFLGALFIVSVLIFPKGVVGVWSEWYRASRETKKEKTA